MKSKFRIIVLVLSLTITQCTRKSTDKTITSFETYSVEKVIYMLQKSYNEQNLDLYMSCFTDDFQSIGCQMPWGVIEEQRCHEKMFSGKVNIKNINLNLVPLGKEIESYSSKNLITHYSYSISIKYNDGLSEEAFGYISFSMYQENSGHWRIKLARERNSLCKPTFGVNSDSSDYFPLNVGNWWYYQAEPLGFEWDLRYHIVDTTLFENQKYYIMRITPISPDSQYFTRTEYFRKDTLAQVWHKYSENDSAQLLYKLNAAPGDTWQYNDRERFFNQITLVDTSATCPTYLGIFKNCQKLSFLDEIELWCEHWLAPEIGLVYRTGEGVAFSLYQAKVKNYHYPPVTAVEEQTWQDLKKIFLKIVIK